MNVSSLMPGANSVSVVACEARCSSCADFAHMLGRQSLFESTEFLTSMAESLVNSDVAQYIEQELAREGRPDSERKALEVGKGLLGCMAVWGVGSSH